jgi:hypothetical protein
MHMSTETAVKTPAKRRKAKMSTVDPRANDVAFFNPKFRGVPDTELSMMLNEYLDEAATSIERAAEVWEEMKRRGCDLSVSKGLNEIMYHVSRGSLLPAAAVRYGLSGRKEAMAVALKLSLPEQRRVLDDADSIVVKSANGRAARVPLDEIKAIDIPRVIQDGKVVPAERQAAPVKVGADKGPTRLKQVGFQVSGPEYDALSWHAAQSKCTIPVLLRMLAAQKGVLKK